jgi:hypothetical protein
MGAYDFPAFMNLAKEKSNGLPVIFIGYAEGATAMLHALGSATDLSKQQILKTLASDFILLAPCVYLDKPRIRADGATES